MIFLAAISILLQTSPSILFLSNNVFHFLLCLLSFALVFSNKMDFNSIYQDALSFGNNLRDCYRNGDTNKDGHLSKQELKAALQNFSGEMITKCQLDELLDDMDPNGDGRITYDGKLILFYSILFYRIARRLKITEKVSFNIASGQKVL